MLILTSFTVILLGSYHIYYQTLWYFYSAREDTRIQRGQCIWLRAHSCQTEEPHLLPKPHRHCTAMPHWAPSGNTWALGKIQAGITWECNYMCQTFLLGICGKGARYFGSDSAQFEKGTRNPMLGFPRRNEHVVNIQLHLHRCAHTHTHTHTPLSTNRVRGPLCTADPISVYPDPHFFTN